MEYSIHELSQLSGLSSRTLRWYDQIGLLKPAWTKESGYRYYGPEQVNRLQDILFYRALGVELGKIRECLDSPRFDRLETLRGHLAALEKEREKVERLIGAVQEIIRCEERKESMKDQEKFAVFKENLVKENEEKYGKEVREKYGDEAVDQANTGLMGLTREEYQDWNTLDARIREKLEAAVREGLSADSPQGKEICRLHRRWLEVTVKSLTPQKHKGIAQLYVLDERFTAYYDRALPGCARFLRDTVDRWSE